MKKFKTALLLVGFLMGIIHLKAQKITQILRGTVTEAVTGNPIPEASISLNDGKTTAATNLSGQFLLDKTPVGRYRMTVSSVGFQTIVLTDVLVESGKEAIVNITLRTSNTGLDTFVVVGQLTDNERVSYPSVAVIEKLRFQYPATYADPARYASYAAGVTTDNDQANNLSIRGVSPNALQWYMQGAEIVNPNHLSNAGTLSDRASVNGGGVMILSAQLLDKTTLYQGAMPTQYSNALAGAIDMQLRKGNDERRQSTISLSLIGLDAATEGYFSKKSKASYLVNYRYATIGLLSKLGVPLGDEAINYQDVSFNMTFPTRKMGEFSVFGIGGTSENLFEAKKSTEWKVDKDSQDISFHGRMGAMGVKHKVSLGKKMQWKSVFVVSALDNEREAVGYNRNAQPSIVETVNNKNSKYFFRTELERKMSRNTEGGIGIVIKEESVTNSTILKKSSGTTTVLADGAGLSIIPYADISGKIGEKWAYKVGARGVYFDFNSLFSLEPSAALNYKTTKNSYIQLSYSRQSQLIQPQFYFAKNEKGNYINKNLDFVKSDNVSLSFNKRFNNDVRANLELFSQSYYNVYFQYINNPGIMAVSLLDDLNTLNTISSAKGNAESVGVALSLNQSTEKGLFWQLNGALFNARFKNDAGIDRSLSYNSRYTANVLLGKEWARGAERNKFFGVSGRVVLRGGFWTLTNNSWAQVKDYFRTDLNIYYKKHHAKWQSTIQLDIQNVTNRENEWAVVYDNLKGKNVPKLQLGMIPNLTYKVEF